MKLRDAIAGKVTGDRTVEKVNRALLELFDAFIVYSPGVVPGGGFDTGSVYVEPCIRSEVAQTMIDADWPDPPMEWVEALGKSGNAQA